jgi:hypothetical protein
MLAHNARDFVHTTKYISTGTIYKTGIIAFFFLGYKRVVIQSALFKPGHLRKHGKRHLRVNTVKHVTGANHYVNVILFEASGYMIPKFSAFHGSQKMASQWRNSSFLTTIVPLRQEAGQGWNGTIEQPYMYGVCKLFHVIAKI